MDLSGFIHKAKTSRFRLWLLNKILYRLIPFNKPHGIRISAIQDDGVEIILPYKNKNLNHIKGLHACALATLAEYTTGFMMLTQLDPKKYRIIMKRIEMDYHFQGKKDAVCKFQLTKEEMNDEILGPLQTSEAVVFLCKPHIYDQEGNHLATGKVHWQVKLWDKVRTKI